MNPNSIKATLTVEDIQWASNHLAGTSSGPLSGVGFLRGRLVHVRRTRVGGKLLVRSITLAESIRIEAELVTKAHVYPDGDWDPQARATWFGMLASILSPQAQSPNVRR